MTQQNRLLGCPFCGGKAYTWQSTGSDEWHVECLSDNCCEINDGFATEHDAVNFWNQRNKESAITLDPDINTCPGCGGPADNGFDRCLPPSPYFCTKCDTSTQNPVKCTYCNDTGNETRFGVQMPCRCLLTMD